MDKYRKKDEVIQDYIIDTVREKQYIKHLCLIEKVSGKIKERKETEPYFSHESIHDDIVRNILILIYEKGIELGIDFEVEKGKEFDKGKYGKPYYTLPPPKCKNEPKNQKINPYGVFR
jgi:hypothetical protein